MIFFREKVFFLHRLAVGIGDDRACNGDVVGVRVRIRKVNNHQGTPEGDVIHDLVALRTVPDPCVRIAAQKGCIKGLHLFERVIRRRVKLRSIVFSFGAGGCHEHLLGCQGLIHVGGIETGPGEIRKNGTGNLGGVHESWTTERIIGHGKGGMGAGYMGPLQSRGTSM